MTRIGDQRSSRSRVRSGADSEIRRLVAARRGAAHASGRGRFDGMITEAAVGRIIYRMGWRRVDPANPPPTARRILGVLNSYDGLAVGRNSDVEGLYEVGGMDRLLHVEVTGAFAASDTAKVGLRRSDNAHKINSRVRLTRDAAIACGACPPVPLIFTSHLAMRGTEAGGVVLAIAAIDGVVVEIDDDGTIREAYGPAELRRVLAPSRPPAGRR